MKKFAIALFSIFLSQFTFATQQADVRMGTEREIENATEWPCILRTKMEGFTACVFIHTQGYCY